MAAILGNTTPDADPRSTPSQSHDFGAILSEGQTLRHEFALQNPIDRPIRLIRGLALTPCCSSIGPLPESIPPRGEARIPAIFKPGYQSGLKQVAFLVETDSKDRPTIRLSLQAQLISAWEAERLEGSAAFVPLGQPGRLTFRVIARRKGSTGRGLPERISTASQLDAAFVGNVTTEIGADGLIEAARQVAVTIPAANQPGMKRGELLFHWPDGRTERMPVGWEVRSPLRVIPAGFVLRRSSEPVKQMIVVESDGRPFRVTGMDSPLLAGPVNLPGGLSTRHTIPIRFDLSKGALDRSSNITITTNHPDQRSVNLSILVLPDAVSKGGSS